MITKKDVKEEVKKGVAKHKQQVDKQVDKLEKDIEESEEDIYSKLNKKAKEKTLFLHSQFKQHSSTAIIAGLTFVIGLTWKDLIVKIVNNIIKPSLHQKYPYLSELITAIVVTFLAIIAIAFVSHWAKSINEKDIQKKIQEGVKKESIKEDIKDDSS